MKRELKFRAFDSKNEYMFYHDEEGNFDRRIEKFRVGSDFNVTDLLFSPFEYLVAMQYTGLKDKKGVEIYEGDIVNSNYFKNASVVFWRYGWHFNAGKDNHYSFNTASHSFEVIGNIHENPELLK